MRRVFTPGWGLGELDSRRDALRTTLWLIPALLVVAVAILFAGTYLLDRAVYYGHISLPGWANTGSADAGRQVLSTIAAAVITVVGVVFSIILVALTLASTQFGPRMLRNFIRDLWTQLTLGTFVATFVYCILALGSIGKEAHGDFVPHISIDTALVLVLVDIAVLVYFIHHVAQSIQLPQLIFSIARDLGRTIDDQFPAHRSGADPAKDSSTAGPSLAAIRESLDRDGAEIPAATSGYLQFVGFRRVVHIAEESDAVIRVLHRPGHFVVQGRPLAVVWPPESAPAVARALHRAHVTGPHRTLVQDPVFAVDQLVEIALRALSPAVNDTFTALTCIDWLGDGLCKMSFRDVRSRVHRDKRGHIRLIEAGLTYQRIVDRAFDKIRQAARGLPAVNIRQLDALAKVMEYTRGPDQRQVLRHQADMILRSSEEAVPEESDRIDIQRRYDDVVATMARLEADGSLSRHDRLTAWARIAGTDGWPHSDQRRSAARPFRPRQD
jgi:uncharacterized membrane protein